jgi:uncharacterized ParB-like nuclease family protein
MPAPSRKDVDSMSNLMKIMNGQTPTTTITETAQGESGNKPVDITPGVKRADVDAMAKIMKGFNQAATNVAAKVVTTISESTKTVKGVDIGHYSVEKTEEGRYNIVDRRTKSVLFEDIQLYETVCCIAKYLNENKPINSPEITKIITINELFERHYSGAIQHKHSYQTAKKVSNSSRMDIAEARFSQAKADAGKAKRRIASLYEDIIDL